MSSIESFNPTSDSLQLGRFKKKLRREPFLLPSLSTIKEEIKTSKSIDWKSHGIRALSFAGGIAVGVLTGLALAGLMVTPVGWGLAGGALMIGLIAAAAYGGKKELFEAIKFASGGFIIGTGFGAIAGATAASAAAGVSIAAVGKSGASFGGFGALGVGLSVSWYLILRDLIEMEKTYRLNQ